MSEPIKKKKEHFLDRYCRQELIKFLLSMEGDKGQLHTESYIVEKIEQILTGTTYWHEKVEEAYKDQGERIFQQSIERTKLNRERVNGTK